MSEGRPSISSARVATGDVAHHSFTVVRRGFDTDEVRSYLQAVSRSIDALEQREEELRNSLAEAEERASHPVIDEATLTASLGQHSAQILRHAHEEAARIVVQAQESSTTLLREAQSQADEIQARGEASSAERVAETELMVATAESEARVVAERMRREAIAEGDESVARAKEEGRALLDQVQAARKRVLADMSARRRALSIQIEQLRAARDEMAASIHGVRDSVDGILSDLKRSDDDARSAAAMAGDEARLRAASEVPVDADLLDLVPRGDDPVGPAPEEAPVEDPPTDETPAAAPAVAEATPSPAEAPVEAPPTGEGPSVDELFARIRAGKDADVGGGTVTAVITEVIVTETESETEPDPEETPTENPDRDLIARRDEMLGPIMTTLSRQVKRALGDDQNRLLDILRSAPSTRGVDLLGAEEVHLATFSEAAQGYVAEAYTAGVAFAGGKAAKAATEAAAQQSAAGMARMVVTMLRRSIDEGTEAGDDVAARVGAAFREWRGERIERLVGDCAVQSFSAGVLAASKKGTVRWVMTSAEGCSDCDDNALAGPVVTSEEFPTGHTSPPAHAGCRCLVTPVPA